MTERILQQVEPRFLYSAMAAVIGLVLLAAYLYVFKTSLTDHKILKQERQFLELKVNSDDQLAQGIKAMTNEVNDLTKKLRNESSLMPLSEMIAHTIDKLDNVSLQHEIELTSVKPAKPKNTSLFEEIPFHIEVSGDYLSLYPWFHDIEKELGPMVVKQFSLLPQGSPERLEMKLSLVAYRPIEGGIERR